MAQREGPRNLMGQQPAGTPREVAERLREKMRELRGGANLRRAAAEAERVLVAQPTTALAGLPRNEEGEAPTRSRRETAERLAEKLGRLHGAAIRRRIETKTLTA